MNTLFYEILLYLHSYNRYLILVALGAVILISLVKFIKKKDYSSGDKSLSTVLIISTHIQLLLGIYLYISSPLVVFTKEAMQSPVIRYWTAEHMTMMLPAIVLITLARILTKRSVRKVATGEKKPHSPHLLAFLINVVAMALIASSLMTKLFLSA